MANILGAILKINPKAEVTVDGDDINSITWDNGTTPIPKADIEAKIAELPTEEEEITARENLRTSGKTKLKAGQALTDDEITALFG